MKTRRANAAEVKRYMELKNKSIHWAKVRQLETDHFKAGTWTSTEIRKEWLDVSDLWIIECRQAGFEVGLGGLRIIL